MEKYVKGFMYLGNKKIPMNLPKDCAFLLNNCSLSDIDNALANLNN